MNTDSCTRKSCAGLYVLVAAGTFLIVAALVWEMRSYTQPPALAAVRSEERLKILTDFRLANAALVDTYDWQDKTRDIVRVPLARAKELVLKEWQNPAAGRSNLVSRAAKAFAPAVAAKNPYE